MLAALNPVQWLAGISLVILAIYSLKYREQKVARLLSVFLFLTGTWCIFAAAIFLNFDLETKITFNRLKMLSATLIPITIFYFSVALNNEIKIPKWMTRLLFLVPVTTVVIILSPWHNLMITGYETLVIDTLEILQFKNGQWFQVHNTYSRILMLTGFYFIYSGAKSLHSFYRKRNYVILAAILFPFLVDTAAVYAYPIFRYLQLVPLSLSLTSYLIVYVIFAQKALEVIPYARSQIITHMKDPCLMWDVKGNLVDFNQAAAELFDLKENVHQHFESNIHLDNVKQTNPLFIGKNHHIYDLQYQDVHNEHGQFVGSFSLLKDITNQKNLESELKRLNEVKTLLLGVMSHDVTSNMRHITKLSEILNSKPFSEKEVSVLAADIQSSSVEVYDFIKDLVSWSKSQMKSWNLEIEHINLKMLVEHIASFAGLNFKEKNLKIEFDVDQELILKADLRMIEICLRNLISNAIKHSEENAKIEISARQLVEEIIITITNSGQSLNVVEINQFFQRSENDESLKQLGIGLLLCKEFLRLHSGFISVEQSGSKATFFVRIPNQNIRRSHLVETMANANRV